MLRRKTEEFDGEEWRRINMRKVAHLVGVEFIHDLYNRYDPRINAIRFRHTVTTWKDGIVNSYAPSEEWEELGRIVGQQYYSLNPSIISATKSLYRRKRRYYHRLMRSLAHLRLESLSNNDLASALLNFQSLVLGELYVLNFVQVEHGLNTAVRKILNELVEDKDQIDEIFADLVKTERPTESQKEKVKLIRLAFRHRILKKLGLYNRNRAQKDVNKHFRKYSYLYSAYGENPKEEKGFWLEFEGHLFNKDSPRYFAHRRLLATESVHRLRELKDPRLSLLVPLLVCGGIFRDRNKALLGRSLKYRFGILNELARRGLEKRESLDFYLLAEIIDLLNEGKKVDESELLLRKKEGIVMTRREDLLIYNDEIMTQLTSRLGTDLKGQCASKGVSEGVCKVVLSKEDVSKVNPGDIMIAIGTDFDLIEAMYRASAVVTEEGGILSHASVVCRELNKPCCIGVKNATRLLKDGQRIRVDATHGLITFVNQ